MKTIVNFPKITKNGVMQRSLKVIGDVDFLDAMEVVE
jgi:hypothetical protein